MHHERMCARYFRQAWAACGESFPAHSPVMVRSSGESPSLARLRFTSQPGLFNLLATCYGHKCPYQLRPNLTCWQLAGLPPFRVLDFQQIRFSILNQRGKTLWLSLVRTVQIWFESHWGCHFLCSFTSECSEKFAKVALCQCGKLMWHQSGSD